MVLHVVPDVFTWSVPEPAHLEHEAFMRIVPLFDHMVEDSLERFCSRRRERRDTPCDQGPGPGWVTLRRSRGAGGVVPRSGGLLQEEGSSGRLLRSCVDRYGTRGPGGLADQIATT